MTFSCGWDEEGLQMHKALMVFYYSIQKNDAFPDLVEKCGEWWVRNGSKSRRKRNSESAMTEMEAPTFEEFENYAGV